MCMCACMGMGMGMGEPSSSSSSVVSATMPPHQSAVASTRTAVDDTMVNVQHVHHRPQRWRSSLASGLRAALACTIVGVVSVYSPPAIRRHITFPAFSYVVTVIVVTDATLGSALRAAVSALHATIMGAVPSVVALWLAHRTGATESVLATAAVVALSTFAVALPESAGPVAKRIALGQIIIIYVARFKQGEHPSHAFALLHPANVVACTALGVAAALLAVLLPCPRLATREAADKGRAYAEMAAERVRLLVDAFLVANNDGTNCAAACSTRRRRRWCMASQAKRLASASANILCCISSIRGDLQWEQVPVLKHCWVMPSVAIGDKEGNHGGLQQQQQQHECIEMALGGMEIALASSTSCTTSAAAGNMNMNLNLNMTMMGSSSSSWLQQMRDQIRLALITQNHHYTTSSSSSSIKYSSMMTIDRSPSSTLAESCAELSPLLFLFSMNLLHRGTTKASDPEPKLVASTAPAAAAASSQDKMTDTSKVMPAALPESTDDGVLCLLEEEEFQELEQGGVVGGEDDDEEEEEQSPAKQTSITTTSCKKKKKTKAKTKSSLLYQLLRCVPIRGNRLRLVAAVKCAFSLGLAVLLGLLFSNHHGFWSGLIVATTMTVGRESTWALATARAHGTALGSVYGVLAGCLTAEMELRFLALLPWIVLATFLKHSRAYGPAGGVAAALSGIIIVGRRYDEPPTAFTIARLVETFIGLSCAMVADLVFQPAARPSARARAQVSRCLAALRDCFAASSADDASGKDCHRYSVVQEQVALLSKYTAEAGSEPTYLWLPPFPAACYGKVEVSLRRMEQLLWLYLQARATLRHHRQQLDEAEADIQRFRSLVSTSLQHLCLGEGNISGELDLEAGKQLPRLHSTCCCEEAASAPEMVVRSFLGHAREALRQQEAAAEREQKQQRQRQRQLDDDDGRLQLVLVCVASIGFCVGEMIKEALQLEAHMLDLALQTH